MSDRKRTVIKIGSSLLANEQTLQLRYAFLSALMQDIRVLRDQGRDVVLMSSGAVALGLNAVECEPGACSLLDKQAAAAIGQPLLINAYKNIAAEHNFDIAQILITLDDMEGRRRFINIKNTIERLFENGIMPIVNENDTITTEELRVGDNDRLASAIAHMIKADEFIMLTSVDGLYDRDPAEPGAQFVSELHDVSQYLEGAASKSALGSGGMLTKLIAANMAQHSGCTTYLAKGVLERPVTGVLDGSRRHTRCPAIGTPESAWHGWLTNRLHMAGSIVVKQAVADEIIDGPTRHIDQRDILSLTGTFQKGDVLHVYGEDGVEVARGLCSFSAEEVKRLIAHPHDEVMEILGYTARPIIIRKDNMAKLAQTRLSWDETLLEPQVAAQ
ncbi:glutamate 5-kinase [Woodsholea maritima]|uniref:glutamate 5-kinase n=1 Tax=Woodsholea maritima TaxID=240237 RepID=UPI000376CECC|nr:glutamate 5-kinase [Woodsholea maritima]